MTNTNNKSLPSKTVVEIISSDDESETSLDWSSDDEIEIFSNSIAPFSGHVPKFTTPICESSSSWTKLSNQYLKMGFPSSMAFQAQHVPYLGEDRKHEDPVFNSILTYMALQKLPGDFNQTSYVPHASESARANHVDLFNVNSAPKYEAVNFSHHMGFQYDEAFNTKERCCNLKTPIEDMVDSIQGLDEAGVERQQKKRKVAGPIRSKTKTTRRKPPVIGFGLPRVSSAGISLTVQRDIPPRARGPPYFYFENVMRAPKGTWETISSCLYKIQPEFVDSIHFTAAARKRGYLHNLPINGRFEILPVPPSTIQEALPWTKYWWPEWDKRTKFNCIVMNNGWPNDMDGIARDLNNSGPNPPEHIRKDVLRRCKRYNYVWVQKNKVTNLKPREIEYIMGYPNDHTSLLRNDAKRYECLANAFQVNTVAYHLSVLKNLFPGGIKVLSLFSGIGGAEVALHRLNIPMKLVVSVEISENCQRILQSWWEKSKQQGQLIHISDVKHLTYSELKKLMQKCGGFDLVIGGSPCNNLSGNNRTTRDGLDGEHSSCFFDYCRILELVRWISLNP
uniref:DNA (cytosine-5-)-methyltransferase n=2 Tax=Daucus carota subsp. sativus TaxID=79200 RepID=A0A166E8R2_DAUCS